jgi:hypothetical protein
MKGFYSFILSGLESLGKENHSSFFRGFFVLNEIQKLLKLYESLHRDTEMYIPETLCV